MITTALVDGALQKGRGRVSLCCVVDRNRCIDKYELIKIVVSVRGKITCKPICVDDRIVRVQYIF